MHGYMYTSVSKGTASQQNVWKSNESGSTYCMFSELVDKAMVEGYECSYHECIVMWLAIHGQSVEGCLLEHNQNVIIGEQ